MSLPIFFLCFSFLSWRYLPWMTAFAIFLLPLYQVRFTVLGLPTNLLEGTVVVLLLVWFLKKNVIASKVKQSLTTPEIATSRHLAGLVMTINAPIALLLVAATLSAIVSQNQPQAWIDWRVYFVEPVLFFFMIRDLVREKKNRQLFLVAAAGLLGWVGVLTVVQKFTGFLVPPYWESLGRMTGPYSYPNAVGLLVSALVPFVAVMGFGIRNSGFRILCLLGASFGVVAVILAQSKGAMLSLAASAVVAGLYYIRKALLLLLFGSVILMLIFNFRFQISDYLFSPVTPHIFGQEQNVSESFAIRKIIWSETWPMLKDNWLLGAGLAGYKMAMAPYHKADYTEIFMYPHNFFFNIWSELGLLGLVTVLRFALALIRQTPFNSPSPYQGEVGRGLIILVVLVGLMAHGLVDVPYFKNDLALIFWFAAAFVL